MEQVLTVVLAMVGMALTAVVIALVTAVVTMWAWNGVIPLVLSLPAIGFWAAFKLNLLAGLLIRSTHTCTHK